MKSNIKVGTRGSELALWQTKWVANRMLREFPELEIEQQIITTRGDKILDVPLPKIGDKAIFTKEIDHALLAGDIDIAVHSLKDVPTVLPLGLTIGAVTERWDVRDALMSKDGHTLATLPQGATIATGSLRRQAQVRHFRPDLQVVNIRGNLNTRFAKYDASDWDAMILAVAGVERLGWQDRIAERVSTDIMLPAVGQGSFAVMCREDDWDTLDLLRSVNDPISATVTTAERAMLRSLEGGCQIPIGALGQFTEDKLRLEGCVYSLDGKTKVYEVLEGDIDAAEDLGEVLAEHLRQNGAAEILATINNSVKV